MKMMLSAIAILGLSLIASPSVAADNRNVSVINETGYAIKFLGFNSPDDGVDECDQHLLPCNTARTAILHDALEFVVLALVPAARTEHGQMAGRSIVALVVDCHACRQHLDLGVVDGAVLAGEVAHGLLWQVHGLEQVPELHHGLGHQPQRQMHVAA